MQQALAYTAKTNRMDRFTSDMLLRLKQTTIAPRNGSCPEIVAPRLGILYSESFIISLPASNIALHLNGPGPSDIFSSGLPQW